MDALLDSPVFWLGVLGFFMVLGLLWKIELEKEPKPKEKKKK